MPQPCAFRRWMTRRKFLEFGALAMGAGLLTACSAPAASPPATPLPTAAPPTVPPTPTAVATVAPTSAPQPAAAAPTSTPQPAPQAPKSGGTLRVGVGAEPANM